ncbi:carboxypeptidase-like regulatory domain-containing protein [Flavobacterium sp. N2820]|uniref:carboxypeptidase-like regulatory domain-containing protein n=1 Tax=Flavobacterium sp. N2820 TaxID=2986834 RepID=UPI002224D9F7|nr:carboxypeptidase-like regulatory domain-containing protein [Flavobacterium sp. N2820]
MSAIIKGTVLNYFKKPIPGATVTVQNSYPEIETTTDQNGLFEIEISGKQTLIFKHENTKQELAQGVNENMTEPLTINMMSELETQTPTASTSESCKRKGLFSVLVFTAGFLAGVALSSGKEKAVVAKI